MQNQIQRIDTEELKNRLARVDKDIRNLEQQLQNPSDDFDQEQEAHDRLSRAKGFRARVQAQLDKNLAAEAAETKRLSELAGAARMTALRAQHAEMCSEMQRDIDLAASGLEPLLERVVARRKVLGELGYEFAELYRKANGQYPNVNQALTQHGVIPGDVRPLEGRSRLYDAVYSFLATLIGQGYSHLFEEARQRVVESLRFKPGQPTNAQAKDESGMSPGEILAARRSNTTY